MQALARRSSVLASALAALLAAALLVAAPALAGPYEPDDTPASATRLPLTVPWAASPVTQLRSLEPTTAEGGDVDWLYLDVDDVDFASMSYLIEARNDAPFAPDPMIEVYGPGEFTPALPLDGPDAAAIASNDAGAWGWAGRASVSFVPPAPGRYHVRIRSKARDAVVPSGAYSLRVKRGQITRIAGADRIATALAISRERYPARSLPAGTVVLASAFSPFDALPGATLCGALGSPLLLTAPDRLSAGTLAEVKRLGAKQVVVLGGPGGLSEGVVRSLKAGVPGLAVRRIYGVDRASTAAAITREAAARLRSRDVTPTKLAFVVSDASYTDALSASPMAAAESAPILYTRSGTLSAATAAALADPALGITDVVILGGTRSVTTAVEGRIRALKGSTHVLRIAGVDRYEASHDFALWATEPGGDGFVGTPASPKALSALRYATVGIASGETYADALAGGVFAGHAGAPVLLTPGAKLSPWIFDLEGRLAPGADYYAAGTDPLLRGYVFGGTKTIAEGVRLTFDVLTGPGPELD